GALAPCGAQCADPGAHHSRPAILLPAGRGDHHRERLLSARPRPAGVPGHHPARPHRRALGGDAAGGGGDPRYLPRGPRLWTGRSAPAAERDMNARALPLSLVIGGTLSAAIAVLALVSFVYTPGDVTTVSIGQRLLPPSAEHWLGTDHLGRDLLSMIMVGARTSIAVALVAVGIGVGLGVPLGLIAAARAGGLLDEAIMRGNDLGC